MAHAVFPADNIRRVLAVLLGELISEDEDYEAMMMMMVAERGDVRRAAAEEERHRRQPTRVEGYVERIIPLYSDQEFKAHFRMERGSFEVRILSLTMETRVNL